MHRVLAVRLYPVLLDDAAVDAIPHRPPDCRRDALRVKLDAQVDVIHPAHDRPAGAAGAGGTRLVTRIHAVYDWQHPLMALLGVILMEFGDFAMLRRMLRGIKARAESLARDASPAGRSV